MIDDFQPGPSGTPLGGIKEGLDIAGDWQGALGERKLRLGVRLSASDGDAWRATLYSIDQSTQPIPINAVSLEGRSLKFAVNAIRGAYEGTISPDGNAIAGTWIQGKSLPLELQRATSESAWLATPTQVHFIEVDLGVKLEVVDWGGMGRPVVLLAGLGADAHSYAKFAARLTPSYHVYGITRRGFGASSVPLTGYSADRLGDDVLAVLAALDLNRPVLVGHSIAGQELSSVGSRHSDKVAGLVYLDAAWSFAYYDSSLGDLAIELIEVKRKMEELQSKFLQDTRPLIQELLETDLPRLERVLREWQKELDATPAALLTALAQAAPHIPPAVSAIHAGRQRYTHIPLPILAIYALPLDPGDRPIGTEAQAKAFEAGVPSARVVRLPHARHEVFSSNEEDVLREMNAFIAKLP
ncbi:alpha/beta fold hydrolase [Granulicella sp. S156]|uniref:alpha/beta fold hydrolase n=1 Tax=Granulicella sp. S156 TaxID=1747224 RepID=UPI00131C4064|nr:alpha/beta hydrolase [Granulicella sp. S156]